MRAQPHRREEISSHAAAEAGARVEVLALEARLAKVLSEIGDLDARLPLLRAEAAALQDAVRFARLKRDAIPVDAAERDAEREYPALGNKSITERIRDHFRSQPTVEFSPAEVMAFVGIPHGHIEAVRAAFRRLSTTDGFLKRAGYARYILNAEEKDHPTESARRSCR